MVADGRLDETFVDALREPAEVFTYGGMIAHVLTFAAHRRTLVALALKKAGAGDSGLGRSDEMDRRTTMTERPWAATSTSKSALPSTFAVP